MRRLLILLALLGIAGITFAQTPEPSPALVAQMTGIEAATMAIRGLNLETPIERIFPSHDDVVAFVTEQFEDPEAQQYYRDSARVYAAFGLLDPDIDIVAVMQNLLVAQIGGFYDPDTKRMNTLLISGGELGDRLPLLEQIVYSHEFTHALQDANFNLGELMGGEDDIAYNAQHPDEAMARLAIIEGDATEVMTTYTMNAAAERPEEVMAEIAALSGLVASMDMPAGTPRILEQELTFPYIQGQAFIKALLDEGGYDAVNEAFRNPPVSTEQIIEPSRYLSGDMPQAVEIADVSTALGEGWQQLYERTAGEFFLRRFLETQLLSVPTARAAGGWGGDTYRFYVNDDTNQAAWAWRLAWDTPEDSAQFYEAMLNFTHARYPSAVPEFTLCWSDMVDSVCIGKIDGDVVVTKAPTYEQAKSMRDALAPVDDPT